MDNSDTLAVMLSAAGGQVDHRILPAGHQLSQADIALSREWIAELKHETAAQ
ncbi:hypothetical protein [Bradyrhizobium sp. McL0616]|uniref:hypothetical protein n=1 Tax=Bradyrhizobium sp. McL0616 TaxID=3415674 RepID=UPI003CF5F0AE